MAGTKTAEASPLARLVEVWRMASGGDDPPDDAVRWLQEVEAWAAEVRRLAVEERRKLLRRSAHVEGDG